MATQSATFTFALPEDPDSDELRIYVSNTETGTYTLDATITYYYGLTQYQYDSLNDTKWYKIRFHNSVTSEHGPYSEPVFGGTFSSAEPLLAISTTTDGANFATTTDVYEYAGLTTQDFSTVNVSKALRRARAYVDFFCNEHNLDRYSGYDTNLARQKYNASLRLIKEAEINIALGVIYRSMSDNKIIEDMRVSNSANGESISIGNTAISGGGSVSTNSVNIGFLAALSDRYTRYGKDILYALQPKSVRFTTYGDYVLGPRFRWPFNGF
jgi:hypothetical protein